MKSKRTNRVAELIQMTIAQLLIREVRDPRLASVTVTGVDLAPDFTQAVVFFTLLNPNKKNIEGAKKAFEKASGFFRAQLSKTTELRHTPRLAFRFDEAIAEGEKISALLKDSE
jgi:ribosome-binding factor A